MRGRELVVVVVMVGREKDSDGETDEVENITTPWILCPIDPLPLILPVLRVPKNMGVQWISTHLYFRYKFVHQVHHLGVEVPLGKGSV